MKNFSDSQILASWLKNARPWINAIDKNEIQSRVTITNQAILDAITQLNPKSALDIGCGEGWLVRALTLQGIDTLGIDAVPELIDHAKQQSCGRFTQLSYENLDSDNLQEHFELAIANFSLLGKDSVENIFKHLPLILQPGGHFIVQTLHPVTACGDMEYADGWQEGTWQGFNDQFIDPPPWYFRTIQSWQQLFIDNGFTLKKTIEPENAETQQAVSCIFIGQLNS